MNREYHAWHSPRLGRTMELLVFGTTGARVLVLPTRAGRFFEAENWGLVERLRPSIEAGNLHLFCVDSVDQEGLYAGWIPPRDRILRQASYERYLVEEVVPFSLHLNPNPFLIAQGCSLGAYQAVNLATRNPGLFGKVVALSGRYDLTRPAAHYRDLFDGHYDEDVYFHTPEHFLANIHDPATLEQLRRLEIILAVGRDDPVRESNRRLSALLWDKGIWHALHLWDGEAHRPRDWRRMVPTYL